MVVDSAEPEKMDDSRKECGVEACCAESVEGRKALGADQWDAVNCAGPQKEGKEGRGIVRVRCTRLKQEARCA